MFKRLLNFSKIASVAFVLFSQSGGAQVGASLNFNGAGSNYGSSNTNLVHGNAFTYETWMNCASASGWNGMMTTSTTSGQNTWVQLSLSPTGFLRVEIGSLGVNKWYDGTLFPVVDGTWHHVAFTWDGTTLNLYVDGNLETPTKVADNALSPFSLSSTLYLGCERARAVYYTGSLDNARVWGKARSQAQIQAYMNCQVTDTATGLLAYYTFNEGTPAGSNTALTTLHDGSFNKLDATLNGFTLSGATSNYATDYNSNYFSLQSSVGTTNCNNTIAGGVAADFNGDGWQDMICTDWNANGLIYFNAGHGNFTNSPSTVIPSPNGGGVYAAADIDGDGAIDFVSTAYTATVTAYHNNGSGVFTPAAMNFFNGGGTGSALLLSDINGDSKPDLIVGNSANGSGDSTQVWINNSTPGNISFTYSQGLDNGPGGSRISFSTGDVNGDGKIDIVSGSNGGWEPIVFFNNNNNGKFTEQPAIGGYSGYVNFMDWNYDGKLDLVYYDNYSHTLRYVLNNGSGNFAGIPATIVFASSISNMIAFDDLNADGFRDIVCSNWGGDAFVFLSNGCVYTQQSGCNYTLGHADNSVTLADFNNDGGIDVFCQARCNASSVYLNFLTPVTNPPFPTITVSNGTINSGQSFTISPTGAVSYTYMPSGPVVSPVTTTMYTVTGANSNGCTSQKTVTVFVNGAALNSVNSTNQANMGNSMDAVLGTQSQITVEAWVNASDTLTTHGGEIIGNYSSPLNQLQFLLRRDNGGYNFFVDAGSGLQSAYTGRGVATIGTWQHIAGVWDGSRLMIYVNGVLKTTTNGVVGPHLNSTVTNSVVMCYETAGGGESFNGSIDEVRIWKRALCQGEIQNSMNAELKLPQTGLLAYYPLNEGLASVNNSTVTMVADSSGNNYNGTLMNFTLNGTTSNWVAPGAVTTGSYAPAFVSPTVTVSGNSTICSGTSTTLTATGNVSTYTWTAGPTTASYVVTPTTTVSYSVAGTNSVGCVSNMFVETVTVNTLPVITASNGTVCVNSSFTISPNGAVTYSYMPAGPVVTPTANATYTVTGTDANGCVGTDNSVMVTVNALPLISASNGTICINSSFTISPNGALTYTFMPTGPVVTPTANATYTVSGTDVNGCMGKDSTIMVTVNALPSVMATANSATVCSGIADTLHASGASTYTWSSNASSAMTASVIVTQTMTTTYTVMGTNSNGCMNSNMVTITVSTCSNGITQYNTSSLQVYPNPSTGVFTLHSETELGEVYIYNYLNQMVYHDVIHSNGANIDLSFLQSGMYQMRIQNSFLKIMKAN